MNEQDFDKLFSSQLPDLADKNWGKLQDKLQNFNLERRLSRLVWALWSLGIFSGLMMATTGGIYYQMAQNQQKVTALENRLVAVQSQSYLKQNTIHQKIIVHDTIYQTSNFHTKTIDGLKLNQNFIAQNQGNENVYYQKNENIINQVSTIIERDKYIGLQTLDAKKTIFDKFKYTSKKIINSDSLLEDSVVNMPRFSLTPSSISVGLTGGYQSPNGDIFQAGDGTQYGFRTVLGYKNRKGQERWGIVLDLQKNDFSFMNREAEEGHINLPSTLPTITDSHLKGADIREFSSTQLSLGLRYNLFMSDKFKPYFGLNWSAQFPIYYTAHYFTEDRFDRKERRFDATYSTNLPTITNIWGGNVGVNYQLSNRFSTGLEAYYQTQFAQSLATPNVLGGRFGLNYLF
jgi:hypothetical protein